jgi:chromosome segregation ATPase
MKKADNFLCEAMKEFFDCDCYQEVEEELTRSGEKEKETKKALVKTEADLVKRKSEVGSLTKAVTNLRLEGSKNKVELKNAQEQKEQKEKEIRELREQLAHSNEEKLSKEHDSKIHELDSLAQLLGFNRKSMRELRKAYKELIFSRKNYNPEKISDAEDKIEDIKDELLEKRASSLEDIQKICAKCESVAELSFQLESQLQTNNMQVIQVPPRDFNLF